ncbi:MULTISPECIES: cysteine hydrolase family protein [Sphingomonas]|jgi:nicotinamidase-related amidase|nr:MULTISPECIES: cysteine hydrolase [Sphingomonas]MDK2768920.1 cysteine hydrolase [Sphingomonas sp.]
MAKEMKIEGRAALIINECQLGVVDAAYAGFRGLADQVAERGILDRIATLADAFRARALPVFHAPVVHRDDLADIKPNSLINALTLKGGKLKKGSVEAEFVPQLKPHPQDFVLDRPAGLIAFNGTNLDATLRRMDIQTVVLTGVSTNIAMPGNTMAAVDLGYYVVIPEDCTAGADPETHRVIVTEQLRMLARITTADEVIAALDRAS